ncbi:DEKNAAC100393 [Brettanomyces naardenensis]|uniref:DEKNAAC100393 n=1 Tax=Brettanomyces naardenensis TaxID=13370 RepID=A0A448YFD6_BRENA|nr:DEKNAAC100393 [Brettanomyces naardenensis]
MDHQVSDPEVTNLPGKQLFASSLTKRCKGYKWSLEDLEDRVASDPRIQPQRRMLTPLLIDKNVTPIPKDNSERIEFPFRNTNIFSEVSFSWCNPILKVGYRRTLEPEDLYRIPPGSRYDVQVKSDTFITAFYKRKTDAETKYMNSHGVEDTEANRNRLRDLPDFKYPKNLVLRALCDTFKYDYGLAISIKLVGDIASAMNSLLVRGLISYVSEKALGLNPGAKGYGYAIGLSFLVLLQGACLARYFHDSSICGAEIKGILTKVLLDKSFKLSRVSRSQYPPSSVTSLLGNDLSKIDLAVSFFAFITNLPVGLALTIILLSVNLGGPVLSGVAWFIIMTGIITYSTRALMKLRVKANVSTDLRIRYVKEVLGSIKIIKYYAWEVPYSKLLTKFRSMEMTQLLKIQFIRNNLTALAVTLPNVSAMIGFLVMFGVYGTLKSPAQVFASLALFNILTGHVAMFPTALTTAGDALVAFRRVEQYLLADDEERDPEYHQHAINYSEDAIDISEGYFNWESYDDNNSQISSAGENTEELSSGNEKIPVEKQGLSDDSETADGATAPFHGLRDINLDIRHGEFVVVTGPIGSGKSSLLMAIKGAMHRIHGSVTVSGEVTLCGSPWIQNATVRDNIYFGNEIDHQKYRDIVDACALSSDFEILPAGDLTEIGERGVNLSGGQKARINLARAIYNVYGQKENNIILFDDVLSAVDAKVGRHIMNHCMLGLLKDKTRVLATHQLALIGTADRIIFMNGDGTIDVGTRDELQERNSMFAELMQFQMEKVASDKHEEVKDINEKKHAKEGSVSSDSGDDRAEDLKLIRRQTTRKEYEQEKKGRLIKQEVRKVNAIPLRIVLLYVKEGCGRFGFKFMIPNMFLSIVFTTFCMLFQNVWLSFWTSDKFSQYKSGFYIGIYVLFTFLFVLCAAWQFCTIVYLCNNAAKNLNIKAMKRIMRAPMSFFDTTPMGRILNRFTKDTDTLDNEIAEQARLFCFGVGNMWGILIMCCIYLPYFAIAIPFIIGWAVVAFSYYQASAREIKRIEGIKRSQVFANFDEVLQGLDTIKFYNAVGRFLGKSTKLINDMNEPYLLANSVQRWLAVRLHVCSSLVNLIVGILAASRAFPISASNSGLLISYLVSFSMQLISTSRSMGQLEQYLSSMERVGEYATELPQEAAFDSVPALKPKESWPENGEITFSNVCLRYRPELPYVLKNFSLHVNSKEKIGICGRTGAGKSTIMTALYRLSEPELGEIDIDGVKTLEIGLSDLRSKLSIIPQDPVLFRGTIRQNLDPFGHLDDDTLYNALVTGGCIAPEELERVKMQMPGHAVELHKFHLDSFVDDNGENFSLGQRQVLALCRALVKDTRILILDEATSSVDYETDSRIQQTISTEFADCTILCIAHRLKTIVNYDRILVMDKGELAEFDTPWHLYNMEGSIFKSMCDKSGISEADFMNKA